MTPVNSLRAILGAFLLCADARLAVAMVVRVRWAPSPDPRVVAYNVYTRLPGSRYGIPQRVSPPLQPDGTMMFEVSGLTGGATYFFAVSALASDATESDLSQELHVGTTNPCDIDRCSAPTSCEFVPSPPALEPLTSYLLVATGSGGEWLHASGTARYASRLLPTASGASLEISDGSGVIYRLDIPGFAFRANQARTHFRMRRASRAAYGSMRLRLNDGVLGVRFDVTGLGLVPLSKLQLTWVLRFGTDACLKTDLACKSNGIMLTCD